MALRMTIDVNDQGAVSVTGPLEDQLVCYGLLEVARDAIAAHVAKQAAASIRPPTSADILSLRKIHQ